jgi:plasmid stabilization system protein ParE
MKSYEVRVSFKADSMLVDHVKFLARVSQSAASDLIDEFEKAVVSLETMPERFPHLNHSFLPVDRYRKMILSGRYILLYQIKGNMVYIDHVLDGRRDYPFL